jgi:hypothetical protein
MARRSKWSGNPRRHIMAKLTLHAVGEDTIASPGNSNNLYIVVSVEDQNGAAVTGLGMGNFAIGSEVVGPGGSISHINAITNGKLPGVYVLLVLPLAGQTWKGGVYIFSVAATRGADHGLTLCSFLMD